MAVTDLGPTQLKNIERSIRVYSLDVGQPAQAKPIKPGVPKRPSAVLVAGIAGRIARWAMKESGLSFVDRILGGAIGLLKGSLIVAVVLMSMAAFTPTSKWLENSRLAPYFLVVGRAAIWVAPAEMRARFYQGLDLLHRQDELAK